MNFSVVFDNSGDTIRLCSVNAELLEYYVDLLNRNDLNSFSVTNNKIHSLPDKLFNLQNLILQSQRFLELIDVQLISDLDVTGYLDQKILNQLHADWVNSQEIVLDISGQRHQPNNKDLIKELHQLFPDNINKIPFGDVLAKLNFEKTYGKINLVLHEIESAFNQINFKIDVPQWVSFDNPFDKNMITNDIANFRISFNHLGRTLYNKFKNFDNNLEFDDENTYDELLGFVGFCLVKPETIPLSAEYVLWCNTHNKIPSGDYLNLGNIPDLESKLTDYRLIFYRNIINNNNFKIELYE